MYKWFGYLNIALMVVMLSPFCVRMLNKYIFHRKGAGFQKLMKVLRALHKPAALLLVVSIVVHGWLAVGAVKLNTGTVAGAALLLTMLFGLLFWRTHKPALLKWHRGLALAAVLLIAVHLLFPWLL